MKTLKFLNMTYVIKFIPSKMILSETFDTEILLDTLKLRVLCKKSTLMGVLYVRSHTQLFSNLPVSFLFQIDITRYTNESFALKLPFQEQ